MPGPKVFDRIDRVKKKVGKAADIEAIQLVAPSLLGTGLGIAALY